MSDAPNRITELIREGKKIEAIKLLRETTGLDLKQAKEEVDRLSTEAAGQWSSSTTSIPEPPSRSAEVSNEVEALASQGQKIAAIKLLREQTGMGLKEAKAAVERATGSGKSGCMVVLLLLAVIGLVAAIAGHSEFLL